MEQPKDQQDFARPEGDALSGITSPAEDGLRGADRTDTGAAKGAERGFRLPFDLNKMVTMVKRSQQRTGFVRFLFKERSRIVRFGYRSHTLSPTVLLPALKLDGRLRTHFAPSIEQSALELLPALRIALERGWMWLSKKEYNLLSVFHRLCVEIVRADLSSFRLSDSHLIDRFRILETLFFVLAARQEHSMLVGGALQQVLAELPGRDRDKDRRLGVLCERILFREFELPSLFNFLLTLNMVRYRRSFSGTHLLLNDVEPMIDDSSFACGEALQEEIDAHVRKLAKRVTSLAGRRSELDRIRAFVPVASAAREDLAELASFYGRGSGKKAGLDFESDSKNVILFVPRLLGRFDAVFGNLLAGKFTLESGKIVSAFAPSVFGSELSRLREARARLEALLPDLRALSQERYLRVKGERRGALPNEIESVQVLEDVSELFLAIAKRLDGVLRKTARPSDGADSEQPLQLSALQKSSASLPHAEDRLRSKTPIGGKTVGEAVGFAVAMCYLAAIYLRDRGLLNLLSQAGLIDAEIERILAEVQRIGRDEEYRGLLERIGPAKVL